MWADVFDYGFEGRCPSKTQVTKVVKKAIVNPTIKQVNVWWGENGIEITKAPNGQWYGTGWIRRTSGQELAQELA